MQFSFVNYQRKNHLVCLKESLRALYHENKLTSTAVTRTLLVKFCASNYHCKYINQSQNACE